MKIEQNDRSLLFAETLIPDVFFADYLSAIPGDYLKIYMYVIFLSKYNKDIKINDISKKLNIPLKTINDGMKFLEENGLLLKKANGYILVDIQEETLHNLYSPNLTLSKEKVALNAKNEAIRMKEDSQSYAEQLLNNLEQDLNKLYQVVMNGQQRLQEMKSADEQNIEQH